MDRAGNKRHKLGNTGQGHFNSLCQDPSEAVTLPFFGFIIGNPQNERKGIQMSYLSHLAHQLKPPDFVQLFGTIVSAIIAVVGSIFGALIGAKLGFKNARTVQQERDRRTEALRLTALLQAVREELSVSWNIYVLQVGQIVETAAERKQKIPYWPCYGDYFIVFKTNATNIGRIENDALRAKIIESYIVAQGHIDTFQNFNRLLAESDRARQWRHRRSSSSSPQSEVESDIAKQSEAESEIAIRLFKNYQPRVLESHRALKKVIEEACKLLDDELKSAESLRQNAPCTTSLFLINTPIPEVSANTSNYNEDR